MMIVIEPDKKTLEKRGVLCAKAFSGLLLASPYISLYFTVM